MIDRAKLCEKANEWKISLSESMLLRFDRYAEFLTEYNQKVNLTAIKDPEGIIIRHFIDSLALLRFYNPERGALLADVGAGAGFPSVPIAVVRDDVEITLMDSLAKRITFLELLMPQMELKRAKALHIRAEDAGKIKEHREHYDIVTARAVADLRVLCEYCLPLVKVEGLFAAYKGPDSKEEVAGALTAVEELGGTLLDVIPYHLPDGSGRTMVLIKKRCQTPSQYPRKPDKIAKFPL